MKAFSPIAPVFALLLLLTQLDAEEPVKPGETTLRTAIARSLDFLSREGDTWMNEKNCNACHHMPLLLWSQHEARRRGFAIDQARLDEFTEWTDEHARKTNAGLEMLAFLKLATPDKSTPELTRFIVEAQQADGSWKPANQYASMQRRELSEAAEHSTLLILLSLGVDQTDRTTADAARLKAAAFVEKHPPAEAAETLVYRALYQQRFGAESDANALRAEIVKLQQPDGGWAWKIGETQSDPLATGEVLYLLQQSPAGAFAKAITRGQSWLLTRQREDGSWPIDITRISKMDRSGEAKARSFKAATDIYIYWGTAWATIGLLHAVPPPFEPVE